MNKNNQINNYYQRFLSNTATREEVNALFIFFKEAEDSELKELLRTTEVNETANDDYRELLQDLKERVLERAFGQEQKVVTLTSRHNKTRYYVAAASATAILSVATIFYARLSKQANVASDLKPGTDRAMLVFDKHDTLRLEGNKSSVLLNKGSFTISRTKTGTIVYRVNGRDTAELNRQHTLTTPRGGEYHVRLSDGTEVQLNSESELAFTVGFTGHQRKVKLTGEAYFEVAHDKEKPFIVSTPGEEVQVLGTKFNISNYPEDEGPVTTLMQGSVKVTANKATAMLKPGQQSRINNSAIAVTDVDGELFDAWKNGEFVFENTPLSQIMHRLARWYDFDIDYSKLPNKNYYIRISKQVNLSEVLRMITVTSGVKFKIEERRVMVM
ncbi:DUF4974 domain-containing protein [Mucilaginibacter sp. RS28]|uniref:DUF4974 domain-containing protein n=1 Tax=Mucilaginibacter straminoryzae TaxID=2932774 RepID=A0A9X1X0X1_9SPHI|nr:FecR family protein [Mucilaginibacter straminoryzae]MCJ8208988.1 DUF4974 domain-containing protein [Mucilaginibacter straminoryzae]